MKRWDKTKAGWEIGREAIAGETSELFRFASLRREAYRAQTGAEGSTST